MMIIKRGLTPIYIAGGTAIASLSLATNFPGKRTAGGERETNVEWSNLVFFGRMAETVAEYVKKGTQLQVQGEINNRSWKDKETQETRYATDIIVKEFQMLKNSQEGTQSQEDTPTQEAPAVSQADNEFGDNGFDTPIPNMG